MPTYSIKKNPARAVPATAPSVLSPYNRASDGFSSLRSAPMNARVSTGSVPPMRVVGTRSTSAASPNRRATLAGPPSWSAPAALYGLLEIAVGAFGLISPLVRQPEHEGRDQPEGPNGNLEQAVQRGGPGMAVGAAAEQPGAEAEAAHVGGHDR